MRRSSASILWVVLPMFSSASVEARPGNIERYPVGAENIGMGGTGIAAGQSVWHNPAGLGTVRQQGVSASLSAYGYTSERIPRFMDVSLPEGAISGAVENDSVDVFPLSLAFAKPLGGGAFHHAIGLSIVLPDYDQFDGALEVPASELAFELRARRVAESKTYWLLAGWGACLDQFCVGAAPAAAFLIEDGFTLTTLYLADVVGNVAEASTSTKVLRMALALGGQIGAQLEPIPGLRLGLVVRSPMRSVWSSGEFLHVSSLVVRTTNDPEGYVDRVESRNPQLDFRIPWRFGAGISYGVEKSWMVALDLRLSLGQAQYAAVAGPNGETTMQPTTPDGPVTDPTRAVEVEQRVTLSAVVNANVGGRLYLSESVVLQAGFFTDFSAVSEEDVLQLDQDRLSRVGATLGAAWFGETTRTWITLLGALGSGSSPGLGLSSDGTELISTVTDLDSKTLMLLIGSSATL